MNLADIHMNMPAYECGSSSGPSRIKQDRHCQKVDGEEHEKKNSKMRSHYATSKQSIEAKSWKIWYDRLARGG